MWVIEARIRAPNAPRPTRVLWWARTQIGGFCEAKRWRLAIEPSCRISFCFRKTKWCQMSSYPHHKKGTFHFSVVLNGEFASTKISAENLFSLPIYVIMGLTKSLPPRGRGTALAVEGACVTLGLDKSYCIALSLSRLRRQLPPGGSLKTRAILGVWALPEAFVIQGRNLR